MDFKLQVKQVLVKLGMWYPLDLLRRIPRTISWLRSGCLGPAPHPIKMVTIGSYLKRYSIKKFVETGTYMGDTLEYIAKRGVQCYSIELAEELHKAACKRFVSYSNVTLVQGDSAKKLPELLQQISEPCLFWLDGHYSAGATAKGESNTPISEEIKAVLDHKIKNHVILIDDARCFNGTGDYPHLDALLLAIREQGSYSAEVSADIIRLVPKA